MRIVSVASGKGGVGKTSLSSALGLMMQKTGCKTGLLDCDTGLANVGLHLGIEPKYSFYDYEAEKTSITNMIVEHDSGLRVITSPCGAAGPTHWSHDMQRRLVTGFQHVCPELDCLLLDTAAGISEDTMGFVALSNEMLMVITPDKASIVDGYALLKLLAMRGIHMPVHILINMAPSQSAGRILYQKFQKIVGKFIQYPVSYLGTMRHGQMGPLSTAAWRDSHTGSDLKNVTQNLLKTAH